MSRVTKYGTIEITEHTTTIRDFDLEPGDPPLSILDLIEVTLMKQAENRG